MDTFPLPQLLSFQHFSVSRDDPTGRSAADSSDPTFGAAQQRSSDIFLRELLTAGIKAELLDAVESIATAKAPVVSLSAKEDR